MIKAIEKNNDSYEKKRLYENSIYIGNFFIHTKIMLRIKLPSPVPVTFFSIAEKLQRLKN